MFGAVFAHRVDRLLASANALAAEAGEAYPAALVMVARGAAYFLQGELATSRLMSCVSMYFLGDLPQLNQRLRSLLADADARGDRYGATDLRIRIAHVSRLCGDEPGAAAAEVSLALEMWPKSAFYIQHWWGFIARSEIALYSGDAAWGLQIVEEQWGGLRRSLLLAVQYIRAESWHRRALANLATAAAEQAVSAARDRWVRAATADCRRLSREPAPWIEALTESLEGVIANANGSSNAMRRLAEAERRFEACGMQLHAAAARYRRAELAGEPPADSWMRDRGILRPDRMTTMLIGPLFRDDR
jgi:hypothetical protein